MVRNIALLITACIVSGKMSFAQAKPDSARQKKWSAHFQLTVIGQWHPSFHALYNGENSLSNEKEPTAVSLTSTIFLGRKLWKGAALCLNPEISGGKGLSFATDVAGALNGETYRVGAVEPKPFFARVYFQQHIALSPATHEYVADDFNQVEDKLPAKRITITAGRFAISDYYDDNSYSKDPRTQFFNWSLWANGAWDYPANTRGYTEGLVPENIDQKWYIRLCTVPGP